jgi:hypothetical protein
MFDLDRAIADWRQQLTADGIRSPEVLDELESHLREEIDAQLHSGIDHKLAFDAAIERIGATGVLKNEFAKVGSKELQERFKHVVLTLAGVPTLVRTMNTSQTNIEPGWATYLKGAAFAVPALFLWTVSAVFFVPKLKEICRDAGLPASGETIWDLTRSNFLTISVFAEYGLWIAATLILLLILLEWRSAKWPRYRRATVGTGAFLLNLVVLISIFMMILTALVAAPALVHHAK